MGSASKTPHMQGGFSGVFDAAPAKCVKVGAGVSFEAAALAEPLSVALHAVARAGEVRGRSAIVFGAGPIGLLVMMAARRAGADSVSVADVAAAPLAFAKNLEADEAIDLSDGEAGGVYDICFEASGTAAGLASAIKAARRGGTVVLIGNLPGGEIPVPANAVMAKELDLKGTFRFGQEFSAAVRLIGEGVIDVHALITARVPLSEAPSAFSLALDRSKSIKVMLTAS